MLYINKDTAAETLLVQLSEPGAGGFLWLKSPFANREKFIPLGPDISPAPNRYEAYVIATATVAEFPTGFCNYAICKDASLTDVLDTGLLLITDNETPGYVRPADVQKDYKVYGE